MRKIEVVPHSREWSDTFKKETEKIKNIFGDEALDIYHIGSTAIPVIFAKPIIDILIEVKDIKKVDSLNHEMELLGYKCKGENGICNRRYFSKGGDMRTHHVHVFQAGSEHIKYDLAFRDYLNSHPEVAKQYNDLKIKLSKEFPYDSKAYMQGKDTLIKDIQLKALDWLNQKLQ